MRVISGTRKRLQLHTVSGMHTRPTQDRIKETLFNMIQNDLCDAQFLDVFAGIEALSRGAACAYFIENNKLALDCIHHNITHTRFDDEAFVLPGDVIYELRNLEGRMQFDIIFIDPPYNSQLIAKSVEKIFQNDILSTEGIIILETDQEERILKEIKEYEENIYDIRRYGRVKLIFMRKG